MRSNFLKLIPTIVLTAVSHCIFAQSTLVSGKIQDEKGTLLDFATISVISTQDSSTVKGTLANEHGVYSISNIPFGRYILKASLFGYKNHVSKEFVLNSDQQTAKIDLTLQPDGKKINLNEIVVVAKKPFVERKADKLVVNVESSSLSTGSTALEVLQRSPGVSLDQNDNISLQGKSGVLVMLDGKQTYMSNSDLATLLKSMQSSEIQTIEIITNPSAKYEAEGNAGIINIVTKKGKMYGTNGSVNSSISLAKITRANTGLNLNHRTERLNLFGNFNYSRNANLNRLDIDRVASRPGENVYFSQQSGNESHGNYYSFKIGSDFFINKNQTLGFFINNYNNDDKEDSHSQTAIGKSFTQADSLLKAYSLSENRNRNTAYNLNYKIKIDSSGQELSTDFDYSNYHKKENAQYDNSYYDLSGNLLNTPFLFNNNSPSDIDITSIKIDYVKPFKNGYKLEMGYKSSWVKSDNNFKYLTKQNDEWVNGPGRSNHFIYDENVNALYFSLHKTFKDFSFNAGLRAEQSNTKGHLLENNNVVKRDYLDFFPTFFVTKPITKSYELSFSYSRRIDRPRYTSLNPFIYYLDEYTYNKGNPFLNPQYTDKFELNHTLKGKYIVSMGYSLVHDLIDNAVILPDTTNNALYQTAKNLDTQNQYYINIYAPFQLFPWWNMTNNVNAFHFDYKSADLNGQNFRSGNFAVQYNMQHAFTISKSMSAELGGYYVSALEYGTLKIRPQYSLNAGLSKNFLKNKLNTKVAVSDIFNTFEQRISSLISGLDYNLTQKHATRLFRFSVSYKFGKNDIKPARRRTSGSEEEQNRL
ncbi:TonB-dependent receptor [Pseudopedobacter saltans DSM 12145]|uniref:TonB-dependent receptor n=1 Tax=Pseudopedobacter saltans (strain ATCC 51119 / DSM 12145 / JCM 21818 / CCUG 39354 / LMG 10337 / NBRC 100064 / NCIMB 13643) TaxID=762903 RepID=F0S6A2_PSESL|nr:outer membrane beta-barrel protein [Pseudopedobacter saltans]ADY53216.1 TonB-dependent receptor [Pseudopedobacter saltans DSM 12145]